MIQIIKGSRALGASPILDNMHRARKHVFVDLLKWNVPVVRGEFERDQFDTSDAIYLVSTDDKAAHLGSFRLLPTDRPHLLGALFAELCDAPVPTGPDILEITRGCLSPRLRAAERLRLRNRLISAAVDYALDNHISAFTCVADSGWLSQILAMGWDCELLGMPRLVNGVTTGALRIDIEPRTVDVLRQAGTYIASGLRNGAAASLAA
ncbi:MULTISPECIES: acyl-homoserine-lactone synthase [Sphingomonas]|jgi:N-acyl-L-homoserine lactone synthetase|uniref:Acyl-homoserine-lactone synthase n=1 Tax=Sphingomonas turrisvirgatae TaxID=1888892 RepID=A0A1E3LYE8_9SPHN|nr:acyl-homoserine-lactone synthase [Sphingomonas turrisvirgatae]ODP38816.1 autoinducer synthase [Sphingomonas turrisvirgatae]